MRVKSDVEEEKRKYLLCVLKFRGVPKRSYFQCQAILSLYIPDRQMKTDAQHTSNPASKATEAKLSFPSSIFQCDNFLFTSEIAIR